MPKKIAPTWDRIHVSSGAVRMLTTYVTTYLFLQSFFNFFPILFLLFSWLVRVTSAPNQLNATYLYSTINSTLHSRLYCIRYTLHYVNYRLDVEYVPTTVGKRASISFPPQLAPFSQFTDKYTILERNLSRTHIPTGSGHSFDIAMPHL